MKSKKDFMCFYDENVDNVFSYYYEKTHNRGESISLTQKVFEKTWNSVTKGAHMSTIYSGNEPFQKFINKIDTDGM